ncbi:MAG: RagB/SusD family nutrient uptake outer membrane protein [Prevotella sp.]|nr:RagB/SusD family nutrient uptake outer membrane protein [Prevotella sp.]
MKKLIFLALFVCAFGAVSCDSNLDIDQKGVVDAGGYYASDADADAALMDMYGTYIQNVAGTEGIDNPEQVLLNYSADDILAGGGSKGSHDAFRVFDEFTYNESNSTLKSCYNRYVASIYHANLVISNLSTENRNGTEPKFTSAYSKQCVEEARVMRAYLHLMMAAIWNRPAILDRLLESDEMPVQAESQEQVLKWVVSECDKAINSGYLPKRNGIGDKDATARMSVGFAQFIAGKAAMFANDPATARKYLGDLIKSGDYKLIPSDEYWTNFHIAGDGNSEKIFEPNYIYDSNAGSSNDKNSRSRWMVANLFNWRTQALASMPAVCPAAGWSGGAIQQDFAKKFVEHDGNSPRRRACFLTEEEFLYEVEWNSDKNDAPLAEKETDPNRGIKAATGIFSHGPYFEWKHMSFAKAPKLLTGGKDYPRDNVPEIQAGVSNQKNFNVARYAEALLLYAEACIGSSEEANGLKALNEVQERSGSGKISKSLTFEDVMEEKQYEMWFENCRFLDLVRWAKQGKVNLDEVYNKRYGGIHTKVPVVYDEFFTKGAAKHKLYVEYSNVNYNDFSDKYMYLPFPLDCRLANHFKNVLGWESLNDTSEEGAE